LVMGESAPQMRNLSLAALGASNQASIRWTTNDIGLIGQCPRSLQVLHCHLELLACFCILRIHYYVQHLDLLVLISIVYSIIHILFYLEGLYLNCCTIIRWQEGYVSGYRHKEEPQQMRRHSRNWHVIIPARIRQCAGSFSSCTLLTIMFICLGGLRELLYSTYKSLLVNVGCSRTLFCLRAEHVLISEFITSHC
jgi:hypothetical protein